MRYFADPESGPAWIGSDLTEYGMTDARMFLINSLRRVIAGGDVTNDQLDAAIPDPAALRGTERKAWYGLSYWADDGDIRGKDPAYVPSRRRQLADLLTDLGREDGS